MVESTVNAPVEKVWKQGMEAWGLIFWGCIMTLNKMLASIGKAVIADF